MRPGFLAPVLPLRESSDSVCRTEDDRSTFKHVYFGSLQVSSEQCAKIMTICGSEAF